MPSRRQFLATAAIGCCGLLAGCVDPAGVLLMREATTEAVVDEATQRVGSADERRRTILEDALENETATVEAEHEPLSVDRPVAYDGEVYALSVAEAGSRTRTDFILEVDFDPADPPEPDVAFEDLPAVDRERLEPLLERDPPSNEGFDVGSREVYAADEREASVLVPEQEVEYVAVDGDPIRVRTEPTETTVRTYEYAIDEHLGSEAAYADDLRETHRFTLEGLSADERAVVDEAVEEGGYYASDTSDEAYEGVGRAFLEHDPVRSDGYQGHWLPDYDGTTYWATLDFLQYEALREQLPEESRR